MYFVSYSSDFILFNNKNVLMRVECGNKCSTTAVPNTKKYMAELFLLFQYVCFVRDPICLSIHRCTVIDPGSDICVVICPFSPFTLLALSRYYSCLFILFLLLFFIVSLHATRHHTYCPFMCGLDNKKLLFYSYRNKKEKEMNNKKMAINKLNNTNHLPLLFLVCLFVRVIWWCFVVIRCDGQYTKIYMEHIKQSCPHLFPFVIDAVTRTAFKLKINICLYINTQRVCMGLVKR